MPNEREQCHLSDEWRTMVLDAVERGMTVTWRHDPPRGECLEVMHPDARVFCYVTTRAELDKFLSEWV